MKAFALITGGSSGMGLQYSLQLAAKGYGIVIVSNRPQENLSAAEKVRTAVPDVDVRVVDADLASPDAADRVYRIVKEWGITIDVLVSNAGILLFSTLLKTKAEDLERIVMLHCLTPVKLIRVFAAEMADRRCGHILIVSSATAWMPYPTISHYAATKAFLKSFSRSLWYEMKRYGVGVTLVCPGAVDTALYEFPDRKRNFLRKIGVMQSPEQTVSIALKALFAKRYRCIPGLFTKIIVFLCILAPAGLLYPLLKLPAVKRILDKV